MKLGASSSDGWATTWPSSNEGPSGGERTLYLNGDLLTAKGRLAARRLYSIGGPQAALGPPAASFKGPSSS